ncbi:hypothetical protein [Paenibacillus tyrfis]|uniref:hypothetical protein n=1 Tax=Paenibacillus tyrfis TaxID=1501230 RepID=UPI0020A14669|nr:hypothetical protein [Paenibacillus tyrfis]MCP1311046.1 hypothetical protein [Paenibacillus tyrfis]
MSEFSTSPRALGASQAVQKEDFDQNRETDGGGVSTGGAIAFAFVCGKYPLTSGFQSIFSMTRGPHKVLGLSFPDSTLLCGVEQRPEVDTPPPRTPLLPQLITFSTASPCALGASFFIWEIKFHVTIYKMK